MPRQIYLRPIVPDSRKTCRKGEYGLAQAGLRRGRRAGVAELVDAPDLGSSGRKPWGFKSLRPHHAIAARTDEKPVGALRPAA